VGCAGLHVAFLWLWRQQAFWEQLPAGIQTLLDVFNIQITIAFLLMAHVYWHHGEALRTTPLGRVLAAGWLIFWGARFADDFLWGIKPAWLAFFALGIFLHAMTLRGRAATTAA
jgi:hypothetical protein